MRRKKPGVFDVVNVIILFGIVVAMLYPFVYMINVSLSDSIYVLQNEVSLWPKGFNLKMYQLVLSDSRILIGYKNTVIYVVLGTAISMVLTSMGAYALSRPMVFKKTFTMLIVFTMLFQGGMIPTFLVVKELGLLNTIWAMVLPGAVSVWNLIIMRTFFQGIPSDLIDSGKMDGLNDFGIFFRLVVPLSKPVIATISLFYAVFLWNNFMYPLLYLTDQNLFPLTVVLRNLVLEGQFQDEGMGGNADSTINVSLKYATIVVTTLPIIMFYPFIQKYFVKGALIGSVKE